MSSNWIFDRDADMRLDWDYAEFEGDGKPRLELHMLDSGCSCCQTDAEFYGQEKMVEQLVRHGNYFVQKSEWYFKSASLLTEYGEAKVTETLILVERISRLVGDAASKARHLEDGTLKEHYPKWYSELGDLHPTSAIFDIVREAMKDYAKLDTTAKMIGEHFDGHILMWIGKHLAELVGYGYQLDNTATLLAEEALAKENDNE